MLAEAQQIIAGLSQATRWESVPNPAGGWDIALVGPEGTVRGWLDDTAGLPVPPASPASDPGGVGGLFGSWRVERIHGTSGFAGPSGWILGIGPHAVSLPPGCNTGSGASYLATPTGEWIYDGGGFTTEMACLPAGDTRSQSEAVHHALSRTSRWSLTEAGGLTLSSADGTVRIDLARPGPTNRALRVTRLRPAATTVHLAKGQTVTVRVLADSRAPQASGTANLTWTVSNKGVVRVGATGAKRGTVTVPLNRPAGAELQLTGVRRGSTDIVLTAPSGVSRTVHVVVAAQAVKARGLTLSVANGASAAVELGQSVRLVVKPRPAGATWAMPSWESSDDAVARVDSAGRVVAVGFGAAVITAKVRGFRASQTVTVTG
jgi:hypothetical protein